MVSKNGNKAFSRILLNLKTNTLSSSQTTKKIILLSENLTFIKLNPSRSRIQINFNYLRSVFKRIYFLIKIFFKDLCVVNETRDPWYERKNSFNFYTNFTFNFFKIKKKYGSFWILRKISLGNSVRASLVKYFSHLSFLRVPLFILFCRPDLVACLRFFYPIR